MAEEIPGKKTARRGIVRESEKKKGPAHDGWEGPSRE